MLAVLITNYKTAKDTSRVIKESEALDVTKPPLINNRLIKKHI